MLLDLTLKITPQMAGTAQEYEKKVFTGHLGTHFDVMDKEFPLEYTERKGVVFDVSQISGQEIGVADIPADKIEPGIFAAFYTGFIETVGCGGKPYFTEHPQLSEELIRLLAEKKVSIIGLDFAGVRRGSGHPAADQYCADRGVFVVENLCNLKELLPLEAFQVHTYPMNFAGMTGLPCRVIAKA